ncbi:unnamed protein product, partial [Tetraodon nigroviridis]
DIHGPEDREVLARLAASTDDHQSADSEAAIEKYLRTSWPWRTSSPWTGSDRSAGSHSGSKHSSEH